MGIVVQKYGGSSVADVDKLGVVADKIVAARKDGHDVVVVVSAMGKTTDQLLGLAREVDADPPRRELDMLLTCGERISMALLSMAVQRRGVEAISFTGSQCGIITNDRHFDARIIEVRPHRVEDELARGRVVIVAGFQGMSYRREITTLGRGGSDTTAIAMAAALGATRAEIYSDVDGVYTADPRVVPSARHLPELSHDEMLEMAEAGAKVLHARAVEIAREKGIRIHARATFKPGRETVVHRDAVPGSRRAVVGKKNLVRLRFREGARRGLDLLAEAGVQGREVELDGRGGDLLIAKDETPDWGAVWGRLQGELDGRVDKEEQVGTVSLVGEGGGALHDLLGALEDAGLDPSRVTTAPLRATALLREGEVDPAVAALHRRAVGE